MLLRRLLSILLIGILVFATTGGARAQDGGPGAPQVGEAVTALAGTGFTYQGDLRNGGNPVTASCDFQFSLFDALSGGTQQGSPQTVTGVTVANGRFTVTLNAAGQFGARAFDGSARWLASAVKCPPDGGFVPLTPRQPLTAAPLAFALPGLRTEQIITSTNIIGGYISNTVSLGVYGATISGGGTGVAPNSVTANYGTIGGGEGNTANGDRATVGGGWANTAGGPRATVGGGQGNSASSLAATIGGGEDNTASGTRATVGGGEFNTASGSHAAVGGGWGNTASGTEASVGGGVNNTASGAGAFIGGGGWDGSDIAGNTAAGIASTIGGGWGNVVTTTATYGTIAGGNYNTAGGTGAFVGGGWANTAGNIYATVGGGWSNTAGGLAAVVPGGRQNTAGGDYSFAAGYGSHADHAGAFVWTCNACASTYTSAADQFLANAAGGFWFGGRGTGNDGGPSGAIISTHFISTSTGAYLSTLGVWTDVSDRNAKMNFAPVSVLDALLALPVESWQYKLDDAHVRHIGPTAQDFYAAFGVGADDTHLAALDTSGVALAAIQELNRVVEAQQARIAALEAGGANGPAPLTAALPWLLLAGLALLNAGGLAGYALAKRAGRRA